MARIAARHIEPEMVALIVTELALAFVLAYVVLSPAQFKPFTSPILCRAGLAAASLGLTSFILGLYRPQAFLRIPTLLGGTVLGVVSAVPAGWLFSRLVGLRTAWMGPDLRWTAEVVAGWVAALIAVRLCVLAAARFGLFRRPIAVLGAVSEVAGAVAAMRALPAGFQAIGVPAEDAPAALRAAGFRTALVPAHAAYSPAQREAFSAAGVALLPEPLFWERQLDRVDVDHLDAAWFAEVDAAPVGPGQAWLNRAGDVLLSAGLLLFTLPVMLLVALLVKLDSPGPVLYRQERVGLGGRPFVVLKFRSMRIDAERGGPVWAQQRDKRVTRVGAVMRRTRIDELPQLLNILGGEMSFIGPRPERPHFVETLAREIPFYNERARVKPGLTGWAQVNYPYGASVADARAKLSYDLYFVRYRSPMLDLAILFATVRVILFQEGAR